MVLAEEEGRFSFLLKPIRDLTKNWDVDIASHLEEYLEELENVVFTFEGGRTMNFAEAALLIQGSTCVYSRKVEYLHKLVYEVLDLLVSKKKKKSSAGNNNGDGADPDVTFADDDNMLLPLDDMEQLEIVMKENEKEVGTIPRRPMSMVPFGDEMGDDQLVSKKGEVLGSRKDFRLNTSQVNRDSCLLLEASAQFLSELINRTSLRGYDEPRASTEQPCDPMMTDDADPGNVDPADDCGDDCNDPEEEMPLADPTVINMEDTPKRSERIRDRMLADKANLCSVPQRLDTWAKQDAFEHKKTEKRHKKMKTFRIPAALDEKKSKKRKWSPEDPKLPLVGEFIANTLFSYKQKMPKVLQDYCLPEFEKLCCSKLSERQAKQKAETKAMETQLEQQILQSEHNQDENADMIADVIDDDECGGVCGDDNDDDDEDVGPVIDWQDDLFHVDPDPQTFADPSTDAPASSYEQLVQNHIEAFYVGAQKYAQTTELSKRIAEWESRILPKLAEEETYGPFDIHAYGTKVLSSIPKGSKIPMAKIMAGKPTHEIARIFLSTLMLANTGNVELTCPGVLEEGMDKAEVTLLRTTLHSEELESYVAPSLMNKDKDKEN